MTFDMAQPQQARFSLLALLALMIIFPMIAQHFGNSWVRIMDMALLYIMLALGLNVVVGFAGLLGPGLHRLLCHRRLQRRPAGFAAVRCGDRILRQHLSGHRQFPGLAVRSADRAERHPPLAVADRADLGVLAALFGALLGAPTLKLRGDYLAIVTLGFGEIIRIFMNNLNAPVNITNGPQGINLIDPIRVFGVSLAGEPGSGSMVRSSA
jgi:branched-chain amino acid transport system permease protein